MNQEVEIVKPIEPIPELLVILDLSAERVRDDIKSIAHMNYYPQGKIYYLHSIIDMAMRAVQYVRRHG